MKRARVIFVNRFYWPDEPATAQLLTDLTRALAARGYNVTVITSRTHKGDSPLLETRDGVLIRRVSATRFDGGGLAGRVVDFVTFCLSAFLRLLICIKNRDTVVAMTDPPMLGSIAWLAARLRGARLIHWVQDIYPEVAAELTGHRSLLLLRPLRDFTWQRAAACVVPGEAMARIAKTAKVTPENVFVSPNWAPSGLAPVAADRVAALRETWDLTGKFVAMYSGNLGRAHDLDALLEVATALRNDATIAFVFVGEGASKRSLERSVRTRALTNVRFFPAQPRESLAVSLSVGDVHFMTLRPGVERWVFPSKLYGIARVERPVLFVGATDSDVARCVQTAGLGEAFERNDTAGIAAALLRIRDDAEFRRRFAAGAATFRPLGFKQATDTWCHILGAELAAPSGPL